MTQIERVQKIQALEKANEDLWKHVTSAKYKRDKAKTELDLAEAELKEACARRELAILELDALRAHIL